MPQLCTQKFKWETGTFDVVTYIQWMNTSAIATAVLFHCQWAFTWPISEACILDHCTWEHNSGQESLLRDVIHQCPCISRNLGGATLRSTSEYHLVFQRCNTPKAPHCRHTWLRCSATFTSSAGHIVCPFYERRVLLHNARSHTILLRAQWCTGGDVLITAMDW